MPLEGRVALVTGGGRGLGRVMALALAAAGARVAITAAERTDELAAVVAEAPAGRLLALTADVTDPGACAAAVARTLDAFGRLDLLVNNAGRGMRLVSETFTTVPTRFWETPAATWRRIVEVNVNGPFLMAQAAMPAFLAQGRGRIVNISTSDVTMVRRGYAPYGPSKAALEAMSRIWAQDLAGTGVTCNVLLPGGATDTELLPGGPGRRGADGQLLDPAIMGPPIVWLAGPAAEGRTGERYIARLWDPRLPPDEAAARARSAPVERPAIM
jgi:NAD(P)-dependent dehydrogenase (short-subunit alcohol dehydrogenase family)